MASKIKPGACLAVPVHDAVVGVDFPVERFPGRQLDRIERTLTGDSGFGLHQPQRELTIGANVARDEVSDVLGDGCACDSAAGLNFKRDIFRDVLRPMLKRVEGDNADRVVELSR